MTKIADWPWPPRNEVLSAFRSSEGARHWPSAICGILGEERYPVGSATGHTAQPLMQRVNPLRNGRGTTTLALSRPRARPGFPVSYPVTWSDIQKGVRADAFKMVGLRAPRSAHPACGREITVTYRRALALGGQVRKGEYGSPVVCAYRFKLTEKGDNGEQIEREIPFPYILFNCGCLFPVLNHN